MFKNNSIWKEKNNTPAVMYFAMLCSGPLWFYLIYIHCGGILKNSFGYTATQVINHNLILVFSGLLSMIFWTYCSLKVHPFKILKIKLIIFVIFLLLFALYLSINKLSVLSLLIFQIVVNTFEPRAFPAVPIFYKHFPVLKRFRSATLSSALSRTIVYVITSFGVVYITKYFDYWGLLLLIIPLLSLYVYGLNYFETLEKKDGNFL